MRYASRRWVDRYLFREYRPRRVLRVMLQDALVAFPLRLQSFIGFIFIESWLSPGARVHWRRLIAASELRHSRERHNHYRFRTPADLAIADLRIKRIVLVGSCLAHEWQFVVQSQGIPCDFCMLELSFADGGQPAPPVSTGEYEFNSRFGAFYRT